MGELDEEVMLYCPYGVEPEPIGEVHLLERLVEGSVFTTLVVRFRRL